MDLFRRFLGAMRKVAHLIGDHGKTAPGFTGTRGFDSSVERQQVGLLRDAFNHIEDVADVVGAGIQGFDLRARQADLLRQLGHRLNGLLDHLTTIIGLLGSATGVLRSIRRVARDLLSGGAQLIDRRRDAVGARTLLVGTDDRSVGRSHHPLRQVMYVTGRRRHFGNRCVNPFNELVERAAQFTELVFALDHQTPGQIALALGNVLHRAAHGGQWTHQHVDQQAQQQRNRRDCDKHGDQRRGAELAEGGVGLVAIDRQTYVPLRIRQIADRGERENAFLAVEHDVLVALLDAHAGVRIDVLEVFHYLIFVRADDHLTVSTDQKRMAEATEIHRVDDLHQRFEAQVTTDHTEQFTVLFHRHGDGHHQATDGRHVRRGQHGFIGGHCLLVPRALTRIVTVRHLRIGALGEDTVGLADVSELKVRREGRLIDKAGEVGIPALMGNVLREVFQHQNAPAHPVLHAAGGQVTGLLHGGLQVLANGVSLQIIVVEREQRERQDHDARSGQEDFMAELEIHFMGLLMPKVGMRFRMQHSMYGVGSVLLAALLWCTHFSPVCRPAAEKS